MFLGMLNCLELLAFSQGPLQFGLELFVAERFLDKVDGTSR